MKGASLPGVSRRLSQLSFWLR